MKNYRVKISSRAKHLSLKITADDGLVVVMPRGYDRSLLADVLASRAGWIEKNLQRVGSTSARRHSWVLPQRVYLPAIDKQWQVITQATCSTSVRATSRGEALVLSGNIDNQHACQSAIRRWLMRYAKQQLVPRLAQVSKASGLRYSRVTIRGQRTRWGSCSSTGAINLNFQLLFVSPAMLNYVFMHELSHTVHMNHSKAFYAVLSSYVPNYKAIEADLKQAWRSIPGWVQGLNA